MVILHTLLDMYFAAVLGVSGLAKVEDRSSLVVLLRKLGLPRRISASGARVVPWAEMTLAVALVSGIVALPITIVVLLLFVCFVAVKAHVLAAGEKMGETDCGCYGSAHKQHVDAATLATSVAQVLLAALNVWATQRAVAPRWAWRAPALTLFIGTSCWLLGRIRLRRVRGFTPLLADQRPHD